VTRLGLRVPRRSGRAPFNFHIKGDTTLGGRAQFIDGTHGARGRLEHACRYLLRPALAGERLRESSAASCSNELARHPVLDRPFT
jgi:hypothetical protein